LHRPDALFSAYASVEFPNTVASFRILPGRCDDRRQSVFTPTNSLRLPEYPIRSDETMTFSGMSVAGACSLLEKSLVSHSISGPANPCSGNAAERMPHHYALMVFRSPN
jgi:hypothetical protein